MARILIRGLGVNTEAKDFQTSISQGPGFVKYMGFIKMNTVFNSLGKLIAVHTIKHSIILKDNLSTTV